MVMAVLKANAYGLGGRQIAFALSKEKAETKCWLDGYGFQVIEYTEDMLLYEFLNSIALAYDPHSSYFTEEIKESFEISLSKGSKDFGIHFIKEDGVFKISSINPGSSAWKSNMVNVGIKKSGISLQEKTYISSEVKFKHAESKL